VCNFPLHIDYFVEYVLGLVNDIMDLGEVSYSISRWMESSSSDMLLRSLHASLSSIWIPKA